MELRESAKSWGRILRYLHFLGPITHFNSTKRISLSFLFKLYHNISDKNDIMQFFDYIFKKDSYFAYIESVKLDFAGLSAYWNYRGG